MQQVTNITVSKAAVTIFISTVSMISSHSHNLLQHLVVGLKCCAMKKKCFRAHADNEGPDQPLHLCTDQGLHCPLTESLDTTEGIKGE